MNFEYRLVKTEQQPTNRPTNRASQMTKRGHCPESYLDKDLDGNLMYLFDIQCFRSIWLTLPIASSCL